MNNKMIEAALLKADITIACIKHGLNLTIHDGKIGFVDQESKIIVALWEPEFSIEEEKH